MCVRAILYQLMILDKDFQRQNSKRIDVKERKVSIITFV